MDILQKYEQEHPQAFTTPQRQMPGMAEQNFFASMIWRLSGGRIQDARQINMVLLGVVAVCLMAASILFFATSGGDSFSYQAPHVDQRQFETPGQ